MWISGVAAPRSSGTGRRPPHSPETETQTPASRPQSSGPADPPPGAPPTIDTTETLTSLAPQASPSTLTSTPSPSTVPTASTTPSVPSRYSAAFWMARSALASEIFITDVTVNLQTVTIRECRTERGFFKTRDGQMQRLADVTWHGYYSDDPPDSPL